MTTTPGQLIARMNERFTPAANDIEDAIEAHMTTLTSLESDGSFEFVCPTPELMNPTVLQILNERFGNPDKSGWVVAFHDPDLIELTPQTSTRPPKP